MKKEFLVLVFISLMSIHSLEAQQVNIDPNIQLPIDEKLALYFSTFKDGKIAQGASRFASYIAREFGLEIIPYLKTAVVNADYFHYETQPCDITLDLVAYIIGFLHTYTGPKFLDTVAPYTMDKAMVQWFVDQYKLKLDEYIKTTKVIDDFVLRGESNMSDIAGYYMNYDNGKWVGGNEIEQYGHPDFLQKGRMYNKFAIQEYYQKRLGIAYLPILTTY